MKNLVVSLGVVIGMTFGVAGGTGLAKTQGRRSPRAKARTHARHAVAGRAPAKRPLTKQEKIRLFKQMIREMGRVGKSCHFHGKRLWGKVKVVKSFPDFKVKVVRSFPDLKVKWVSSFPSKCGLWKRVKSFPDFKIKFVTSFPDFTIKVVTSFPGVR